MNETNGIEVEGLVRVFKKGPRAVDGIDLQVAPGEIYGFLGPNGAGKTTTVRMLCTLLPPTAGSARVAGVDVLGDPAEVRRRIGVALQEIGLDPVQTGRELLELLGLVEAAERRTKTCSGGMKRRLDLASAVVRGETGDPTDQESRSAGHRAAARVTAMNITIHSTFLPHDDPPRLRGPQRCRIRRDALDHGRPRRPARHVDFRASRSSLSSTRHTG